jgi:hypothetical protein
MDPAMDPAAGGSSGAPGGGIAAPAIRASDRERDAATHRLQDAFAGGRLDDAEFDVRMRSARSAGRAGGRSRIATPQWCTRAAGGWTCGRPS